MAKQEHQRREEEEAQEKAIRQPVQFNALPVQQFRAVNEDNQQEDDPPGTPENTDTGSARFTISETEESIEVFPKLTSDDEAELPNTESEEENLRDDDLDYELEPEYHSSEEDIRDPSPSPERVVTFTPSSTKNARRNAKKRKQKKLRLTQDQYEENKKKINIKRRLYTEKKSPFLRIDPPRRTQTAPPETQTDSDARADPRPISPRDQTKRRRESHESIEEVDPQGRKLPKNKNKHRRH